MTSYVLEARSLEHRCQCCGEFADAVFCEGCDPHAPDTEASAQSLTRSLRPSVKEQAVPRRRH